MRHGFTALKKAVASSVVAALILTAPGLPFYQALALGGTNEGAPVSVGANPTGGAANGVNPAVSGGAATANGGTASQNLKGGLSNTRFHHTGSNAGDAVEGSPLPAGEGDSKLPAAFEDAQTSPETSDAQPGIYGVIGQIAKDARGGNSKELKGSDSELLAPSAETLNDAGASQSWARRSFHKLFGLGRTADERPAAEVRYGLKDAPAGLKPSAFSSARSFRAGNGVAPQAPVPSAAPKSSNARRYALYGIGAVSLFAVLAAVSPAAAVGGGFAQAAGGHTTLAWLAAKGFTYGNWLALFFPFGEIIKLLQKRKAEGVPLSGVTVGFGASMINFMVAASSANGAFHIGGLFDPNSILFWAFQNMFSGVGLLGIAALASHYQRHPKASEAPLPNLLDVSPRRAPAYVKSVAQSRAVRLTLLGGAILLAVSIAASAAGMSLIPALLPALNAATPYISTAIGIAAGGAGVILLRRSLGTGSKKGIAGAAALLLAGIAWTTFSQVTAFAQLGKIISSLAFVYLVIPDVLMMWKTKDAGEHSAAYHWLLGLASIGFTFWALDKSVNDADHFGWAVMTGVYFLSAVFPGIALWLIHKFGKDEHATAAVLDAGAEFKPAAAAPDAKPLPPAVKIEAAASPGVGKKVLEYMDKMDAGVKFLAFDLNWAPFGDKLVELQDAGVSVEGYADRRQAFTPTSLVGLLIKKGVPIKTVSGLLTHATEGDDGDISPETVLETLADGTKGRRGIQHMKVLMGYDKQGNRYLIIGSANFTRAAMGDDGVAANHDSMIFLTFPKDHPAESFKALEAKFETIKAQAADSTQDPAPPVHDPLPGKQAANPQPVSGGAFTRWLARTKGLDPDPAAVPQAPERGLSPSKDLHAGTQKERVTEDFLGLKTIHGVVHDAAFVSFSRASLRDKWARINPADAAAVQALIARTFGIPQADLERIARDNGLPLSDRAAWLRLYDAMQAMNRRGHDLFDGKKHEGGASVWTKAFWTEVGRTAASDMQKYQVGALFAFPVHLFDMFVLGYFRRAWSFGFFHSHEDFLSIGQPGMPARVFENLVKARAPLGTLSIDALRARPAVRAARQLVWEPLLAPLAQFTVRRASLAIFSAISMGFIGSFAVFPFMHWSLVAHFPALLHMTAFIGAHAPAAAVVAGALTAVPSAFRFARGLKDKDGKAIAGAGVGLAISAGLIFLAPALGPVFEKALNALLRDIVVGPLLQTLVLSTLLTYPKALAQARADERRKLGMTPDAELGSSRSLQVALGTFGSWGFQKQLLGTFVGMITVGAEIEGVMTYAGALDGMANVPYHALTGREFHLFELMGAAVERPAQWKDEAGKLHENLIPFGGAITWGNNLLYHAQDALGFNLSDAVLGVSLRAMNGVAPSPRLKSMIDLNAAKRPVADSLANRLVHADKAPELSPKDKEALAARLKAAIEKADASGDRNKALEAEAKRTRETISVLQGKLREDNKALAGLKKEGKPLPADARKHHQALSRELEAQRSKLAMLDKMAQRGDLLGAGKDEKALKAVQALDEKLKGQLPERTATNGLRENLQEKQASLAALQQTVAQLDPRTWGKSVAPGGSPQQGLTVESLKEIRDLLDGASKDGKRQKGLFELQEEAKGELNAREQASRALAAVRELRNRALNDRRGGKEMMDFRQNLSKLAMVVELSFQLNKINAAQAAIKQMEALIDARIAALQAQANTNNASNAVAQSNLNNINAWNQQVDQSVAKDNAQAQDFDNLKWEADNAVLRIQGFRSDATALLAQIDAADRQNSGSAMAEYNRVLNPATIAAEVAKAQGAAGATDTSVQGTLDNIATITQKINDAQSGVAQIDAKRFSEAAGLFIYAVPGTPSPVGSDVSTAGLLRYIDQRKAYWTDQKATYQKQLDDINAQLDPNNTAMEAGSFGVPRPVSKVRMLSDWRTKLSSAKGDVSNLATTMDQLAGNIESIGGGHIPRLSGLGYTDLANVLSTYVDAFHSVSTPNTVDGYKAKFQMLQLADMLLVLAHRTLDWAEADKTVSALNDAVTRVLPLGQQAAQRLVATMQAVIDDGEQDRAWVNTPLPTDPTALTAFQNTLIDRKRALLTGTILPNLTGVQQFLQGTLLKFAQDGVTGLDNSPGHADNILTLYEKKKEVYQKISDALTTTFPWIIASGGAKEGDTAAAGKNVQSQIAFYNQYLTGWNDAQGHHEGIHEYEAEVAHRIDPNYTGRDTLYGQDVAYSLPRRITEMSAKRDNAYAVIQSKSADFDKITADINSRMKTAGLGLAPVAPLAPLAKDPNNLKDLLTPLGNQLKAISDAAKASGQPLTTTDANGAPVATNMAALAKDCFDALSRLLPADLSPNGTSIAENTATYLFNDGVVKATQDAMATRIPRAQQFLSDAETVLQASIADLNQDLAWVNAYPGSAANGGGQALLDRKALAPGGILVRQSAFAAEGAAYFRAEAASDAQGHDTISQITQFYQAQSDMNVTGTQLENAGIETMQTIRKGLEDFNQSLEKNRHLIQDVYLPQLNDPHFSALHKVSESIDAIQKKTEEVLRRKVAFDKSEEHFEWSSKQLEATLREYRDRQQELADKLKALPRGVTLDPALLAKVQKAMSAPGAWMVGGAGDPSSALVIKKADWPGFAEKLLTALKPEVDMTSALQGLVNDPSRISQFLAGSKVMNFGDDADGFYLVSQSQFATPGGIETSSSLTLGNVANLWGQKLSVTGYHFASPPNDVNAPWGDQGLAVSVESIEGKNWVNYLDVTFHRNLQDIPTDMSTGQQFGQTRMMVFDDFAMLLMDGKLYIGMAGFGDWAMTAASEHPYYYGGNLKTSIEFHEAVKLNASQQELYAKDPRAFMQTLNLDFTGFDPSLNKDFVIAAHGDNKEFHRTQIGPTIDLQKLMKTEDAFSVDVYVANQWGSDDIAQKSVGGSVLKGFSFPLLGQKATVTTRTGGELGQQYDTLSEKVTLMLPETGLSLSADGKIMGGKSAYYFEAGYQKDEHSDLKVGYGSRYVGERDRLYVTMQSHYKLSEIFSKAVDEARDRAKGGTVLKPFNESLEKFLASDDDPVRLKELKRVYDHDVARQLYTQDIGTLAAEIRDLQRAGSLFHNTEVRSMVGFVSGPTTNNSSDMATTAGWQVGALTTATLSKTQKELLDKKIEQVFLTSVKLEERLIEATRQWQSLALRIHQAEADARLASYLAQNAPDPLVREQAEVRLAEANARKHQAAVEYNTLTGRAPDAPTPFDGLSQQGLARVLADLQRTVRTPGRLTEILSTLPSEKLQVGEPGGFMDRAPVSKSGFNIVDYLPLVENIHFMIGTSLQDMMGGQLLGVGAGVKLNLWDANKGANAAYQIEEQALVAEMAGAFKEMDLKTAEEADAAQDWAAKAAVLEAGQEQAAAALQDAMAQYRNGLVPAAKLWEAADRWQWYSQNLVEAKMKAGVSREKRDVDPQAYGRLGAEQGKLPGNPLAQNTLGNLSGARSGPPGAAVPFDDVTRAYERARSREHSATVAELEKRAEAAEKMEKAVGSRINKVSLELNYGTNITSSGIGWLPAFGVTGISLWPIVDFQIKPGELADLEGHREASKHDYYDTLEKRAEVKIGLDIYKNYLLLWTSEKQAALYREELIPQLERALAKAPAERRAAAQEELDHARQTLIDLEHRGHDAQRVLDYLMDLPLDTPITPSVAPQALQAWVEKLINDDKPVALESYLYQKRVDVAMDAFQILGKHLQLEEIKGEPISLVIRALGRAVSAATADPSASPEVMESAKQQVLEARRGKESFQRQLPVDRARIEESLSRVRAAQEQVKGGDPASRIAALELAQTEALLAAELKTLSDGEAALSAGAPRGNGLPTSFAEMKSQLEHAAEARAVKPDAASLPADAPIDVLRHAAEGNHRIFDAKTHMDGTRIDQTYTESWTVIALRDPSVDKEKVRQLAAVERDKGDKLYEAALAKARAEAETLAAEFEMYTQLYRAASARNRPAAASQGIKGRDLDAYQSALEERLESLRQELVARAGLDPKQATLPALMALVPESAGRDPLAVSRAFLGRMQSIRADAVGEILFDGLLPQANDEDIKISKLKADMTAQRMSYKGFTPLFAFGTFRGVNVWTGAIEAPNPEQVQAKLTDVLGESLRRAIGSEQQKKELGMQLHSLLRSVDDGTHIVEKRQQMLEAAQNAYAAEVQKKNDGMGSELEVLKAEQNMVQAFSELTESMVKLRMDFVSLVADLQAVGLKDKAGDLLGLSDRSALPAPPSLPDFSRFSLDGPKAMFLDYASARMADPAFARALLAPAAKVPGLEGRVAAIQKQADTYGHALADAGTARSADIDAPQRLNFLTTIDAEGRRQAMRTGLLELLESPQFVRAGDAAWLDMLAAAKADLDAQTKTAGAALADNDRVLTAIRAGYWHGRAVPPGMEGDFKRLEDLWQEKEAQRQALYREFLASGEEGTLDFLVRNTILDKYLRAQDGYDKELLELFGRVNDPELVRALDTLYGYRESSDRRKDTLAHGRGLAALDALIELSQARLDAFRASGAADDRLEAAAQRLEQYKELKDRWSKDASELSGVYAALALDASGASLWDAKDWLTAADVERLKQVHATPTRPADRVVAVGGRDYFVPRQISIDPQSALDAARLTGTDLSTGKEVRVLELVRGADVRRAAKDAAGQALEKNQKENALADVFKTSEFALMNGHVEALSRSDFDRLRAQGKLLYFAKDADPMTGLHNAIHPWLAAAYKPGSYETLVFLGAGPLSHDRFAYRESIPASELEHSFKTLVIGPKGYDALAADAQEQVLKARRSGYLSLKLTSYGFALDKNGGLRAAYLTSDEYEKAIDDVKDAHGKAVKAQKDLDGLNQDLRDQQKALYGRSVEGADSKALALDEQNLRKLPVGGRAAKVVELTLKRDRLQKAYDYRKSGKTEPGMEAMLKAADLDSLDLAGIERRMTDAGQDLKKAEEKAADARKDMEDTQAKITVQTSEVARLRELETTGPTLSFFRAEDMAWQLDAQGVLVGVEAKAERGPGTLSVNLGEGAATKVDGKIYGVELDKASSRVVSIMRSKGELDAAVKQAELQDIDNNPHDNKSKTIETQFRVWKVINPKTGNQIYLSGDMLVKHLEAAQGGLSHAKHFAYLPQNWLNLLLQIPRGIVQAPEELAFGIDPEHQGYMGEALLLRGEGGGVPRHGVVMSAVHFLDFLELIPDPDQPYLDPGQFPQLVEIDGPLKPGESVFQKDPHTLDGQWDVRFGKKSMEREVAHAEEDLAAYRAESMLQFKGGYQKIVLEQRRGVGPVVEIDHDKDGKPVLKHEDEERTYKTSLVKTLTGVDGSVQNAAGAAGDAVLDSRTGLEADADVTPGNLEIDRVHEHLTRWPGAEGYQKQASDLKEEIASVDARLKDAAAQAGPLADASKQADVQLSQIEAERAVVRAKVDALEAQVRKLARQIGEHDARQAMIRDLEQRIAALRHRLAMEEAYLKGLKDAMTSPAKPQPNPPQPTPPGQDHKTSLWKTVLIALAVGIALVLLFKLIFGRKDTTLSSVEAPVPGLFRAKADWLAGKIKGWMKR